MKELPILFRAEMVRAILGGRKTQTRRIIKHPGGATGAFWDHPGYTLSKTLVGTWRFGDPKSALAAEGGPDVKCPWDVDRLWVKETFYCDHVEFPKGDPEQMKPLVYFREESDAGHKHFYTGFSGETAGPINWTPSIFMPRWASRIDIEITAVRAERLHEISEADAKAEGCQPCCTVGKCISGRCFREGYSILWAEINGTRSWNANPWVWVIEFKRL